MMQCPKCGRYMDWSMSYSYGMTQVIWKCPCGYSSATDRAGLRYDNVSDRYKMYGINMEYRYDKQNERTY